MKKTLVVRASGGLSNRLQAVLAGVAFCLLTNRAICVDWRDGLYSDDFSDVFHHWFRIAGIDSVSCTEVIKRRSEGATIGPPFWTQWLPEAVAVEYLFPGNDHTLTQNVQQSSADLTQLMQNQDILVFWAWNLAPLVALLPLLKERFTRFSQLSSAQIIHMLLKEHIVVNPSLLHDAEQFTHEHFGATAPVGIHIRHTDLQSPLPQMIAKLHAVAGKDDGIFLCTDNRHVETMVCRLFPRTVTRPKIFQGKDTPLHCHVPGISNVQKGREALMDMLLLARCRHIIHYAPSSFARIPALLSGLSPEYIHSVT